MYAFYTAASQGPQHGSQERLLFLQVDPWNLAARELVYVFVVFASTHFIRSGSDNYQIVSFFSKSLQDPRSLGLYQTEGGDDWRRFDRFATCRVLVVEANLAADTGHLENLEIVRDGSDGFPESPVDFRIPGVSILEVIDDRDWFRSAGCEIAECFRNDSHRSPVGIHVALLAVAICCQSKG